MVFENFPRHFPVFDERAIPSRFSQEHVPICSTFWENKKSFLSPLLFVSENINSRPEIAHFKDEFVNAWANKIWCPDLI